MTRARDIANLVDSNGDIVAGALDNVPAADLVNDTTPELGGTLDVGSHPINSTSGVEIQHNGATRVRTIPQGIQVGGTAPVSSAPITSIVNGGNSLEWGHGNAAGYRSTLGALSGGGQNFLAFNAEHGTNANTYRTRGIHGTVFQANNSGGLNFGRIANATGDNQTLTTVMQQHERGYMDVAYSNSGMGTSSWHVVKEGPMTRCFKRFSAGSSSANVNLFYMRRHYWGGGHYKIILKRTYYNDSSETHYWIDGNSRPGQGISVQRSSQNSDLGSARIYQVSRSSSYPGDNTVAEAVIWGLNIPSYMQFTVILEFDNVNGSWRFDDAGLNQSGNTWRLL